MLSLIHIFFAYPHGALDLFCSSQFLHPKFFSRVLLLPCFKSPHRIDCVSSLKFKRVISLILFLCQYFSFFIVLFRLLVYFISTACILLFYPSLSIYISQPNAKIDLYILINIFIFKRLSLYLATKLLFIPYCVFIIFPPLSLAFTSCDLHSVSLACRH